jgi:hypothetical protein
MMIVNITAEHSSQIVQNHESLALSGIRPVATKQSTGLRTGIRLFLREFIFPCSLIVGFIAVQNKTTIASPAQSKRAHLVSFLLMI